MQRYPRGQRVVAAILAEARERAGLSARELARRMKKPHNYIARIESMERHVTVEEFVAIARALEVRAATLMRRIEARC